MLQRKVCWAAVLGLVASLVLLTPIFVTAAPEAWQRPIVIGWTPPDVTGVFRTATTFFERSVADANKHGFNVRLITRTPAGHRDFAGQLAILEDFITMGVDVIAVSPIEIEVVRPAIRQANRMGIPVIALNLLEPIEGVALASYIGFDNSIAGSAVAYAVLDYFGGPGVLGTGTKVDAPVGTFLDLAFYEPLYAALTPEERAAIKARGAVIGGVAGGFFDMARRRGFFDVINQFPGIEIIGDCAADWMRARSIKCTEVFLERHPTGLDFIWANSNELGLGAMLASEAAGRRESAEHGMVLGDTMIAVFTHGVTAESATRVQEGRLIAEVTHGFPDWGWFATYFAVRVTLKLPVPEFYDIRPRISYIANAHLFHPALGELPALDWQGIIDAVRGR